MESDERFYELRISLNNIRMNAADFRRIALSLEGAQEGSHMGAPDFRVDGRIFATLASEREGYGNLILTPEQQAEKNARVGKKTKTGGKTRGGRFKLGE
jgi:hypothetical protein